MKRLALSIILGFLIPFLYAVIVAPLTPYIKNPTIDRLAMYPVRWPILVFYRMGLVPFENEIALIVYIIVCNVVLYSLLGYILLWAVSKRRKGASHSPPQPPTFT